MPRKSRGVRPDIQSLVNKFGIDVSPIKQVSEYYKTEFNDIAGDFVSFLLAARSSNEVRVKTAIRHYLMDQGRIPIFIGYEWMSFKLPGGSYTPDFSVLLNTGVWVHFEAKGSHFQSNFKDSRSKLRAAASLNPWAEFVWIIPKPIKAGGGWDIEVIKPDPRFLQVMLQIFDIDGATHA